LIYLIAIRFAGPSTVYYSIEYDGVMLQRGSMLSVEFDRAGKVSRPPYVNMTLTVIRMIRILPLYLLFVVGIAVSAASAQSLHVSFDRARQGAYTEALTQRDWGKLLWASLDRARLIGDEEALVGNSLQVAYPQGKVGPKESGASFNVVLPPAHEYYLTYCIRFSPDFDFRLGGKLPGLASGGAKYTGGNKPVDGDGWSTRYMWRENGALVLYFYHLNQKSTYGDTVRLGATLDRNRWYRLTQRIRVNSPGRSNGILQIWVNAKQVYSREDVEYRSGHKDTFLFSTFHGGAKQEWAPQQTCHAYFDDFTISTKSPLNQYPEFLPPSRNTALGTIQQQIKRGQMRGLRERLTELARRAETPDDRNEAQDTLARLDEWIREQRQKSEDAAKRGDVYAAAEILDQLTTLFALPADHPLTKAANNLQQQEEYAIGKEFAQLGLRMQRLSLEARQAHFARFAERYPDSYYGRLAAKLGQQE